MSDGVVQPAAPTDVLTMDRALALVRLARALAHSRPTVAEVAAACVSEVEKLCRATAAVTLLSPDGQSLHLAAVAAAYPDDERFVHTLMTSTPLRVGEGLTGRSVATGQPQVASGLTAQAYRNLVTAEQLAHMEAEGSVPTSVIARPLVARGHCIGALTLISYGERTFDAADVAFSAAIADQAALALANARLVDELTQANVELLRTQTELRRSIAELDSFSSSVSHDLRGPVRAIAALAQLVVEEPGVELPDATVDLLHRIGANAQRMGELIDDLLRLARTGRHPMHCEDVDVSDLAREVTREIGERHPDRAVAVTVAEGLVALADRRLLRIVLENLIDNAFKFTGRTPDARVEVISDGPDAIAVRDNGVGFDRAHRSRLFQPFQRLHTQRDFPGHGIGLATVQRIVERHGGNVAADSSPGGGAVFRFTLPRRAEAGSN